MNEAIIRYIKEKYRPEGILVYGSFADGTNGADSDFDALVIAPGAGTHDGSWVDGIRLDVFVYPPETFRDGYDPQEFLAVRDGVIVLDKTGAADSLQRTVRDFIASRPEKSGRELRQDAEWCRKMLVRTARGDAEGFFRWHWLLTESLEIYCELRRIDWCGPKKSLRTMKIDDPEGYAVYARALETFERGPLEEWIAYLMRCCPAS